METKGLLHGITKFEGKNYSQWKFSVLNYLQYQGIDGIANATEKKPATNPEDRIKKDAQAKFVISKRVKNFLRNTMCDERLTSLAAFAANSDLIEDIDYDVIPYHRYIFCD